MKKVILANPKGEEIKFLVSGERHGVKANEITIDAKGIVVKDEDAVILEARLGMQINVVDVVAKDVAKEAEKAAKEAEKAAKEAEKAASDAQAKADADAKKEAEKDAKAAGK